MHNDSPGLRGELLKLYTTDINQGSQQVAIRTRTNDQPKYVDTRLPAWTWYEGGLAMTIDWAALHLNPDIMQIAKAFWADAATQVELKLRNAGSEVAFVKEVTFYTVKHWQLLTDRNHRAVDVSATYDISISEKTGSLAKKKIHHEIKPQETDRIRFKLHSKFSADLDGLSLYLIQVNVHYNEEMAPASFRQTLVNIRPPQVSEGSYFGGYSNETLKNNKYLAREILKLHTDGVGVEDYVI